MRMINSEKENIKILIYGEPYKWAMAYNLMEAYQYLGHRVNIFDWTQYLYRIKHYSLKNRILDRVLFTIVARRINDDFLKFAKRIQYDLLIVLKGIHLFPETIMEIKKSISFVVNWNPDDFFNPLNNSRYLLGAFDKYDCIFTSRGHLKDEYYKKGAKQVEILNWYYLPQFLYPIEVSSEEKKKYGSDLVFLGTWSKRREDLISHFSKFDLRVWGAQWHHSRKTFRKNIACNPPIFMDEMCKAIISSKINLNMLTKENRDTTNIRNFEIPACSGFQLSERSPEILQLFEEDKEVACFDTPEEMVSKCDYYLQHKEERDKIRLNGYQRLIKGNHTMSDRAREILAALAI